MDINLTMDSDTPSIAEMFHMERESLPTSLSSDQLRALDVSIRQSSIFSARTTSANYLQSLREKLGDLIRGDANESTIRFELQEILKAMGYTPEGGFPESGGAGVPSAVRGSLEDLSSEQRLSLILNTQREMANGFASLKAGSTDVALFQFPCWELVRLYMVEIPRGERQGPKGTIVEVPGDDWPSRWETAGGTLYDGDRMIAGKDDEVWNSIGSTDLFPDGFDNPFPPFAFNSGMGWRAIDRDEAIELGVIDEDDDAPDAPADAKKELPAFITIDGQKYDKDILDTLDKELEAMEHAG